MTNSTKVKICGITTPDDANLAANMGADYIGLIFVDSPRTVNIAQAREIRRAESRSLLVGVFMNTPKEEVIETTRAAKLDLVQLHGDESPDYCDDVLARTGRPIIKAFRTSNLPDVRELSRYRTAGFFLFDIDRTMIENPPSEDLIHRMWDVAARKRRKGFRIFLAGALDMGTLTLGNEHPIVLAARDSLARLYKERELYVESESLFEGAIKARSRVLGAEHPDTLDSAHGLSLLYTAMGRHADAEQLLKDTLASRRRVLREEHPDILDSVKGLIALYEAWGKPEKAQEWRAQTALINKR
jgi:phosphoribosylanthranilate isomerase